MKTKTIEKKLNLEKKTIADLQKKEMNDLQGGYNFTRVTKCGQISCYGEHQCP